MPPSHSTLCVATFFRGCDGLTAVFCWVQAWNSSGSANSACAASFLPAERWKCFFGQEVAKHVKTPLFVLNSKYDSWQVGQSEQLYSGELPAMPDDPKHCTGSRDHWLQHRAQILPPRSS